MTESLWGGLVTPVTLETREDARGTLTPVTFAEHGFDAVRAFVVTAPDGAVRGGHGHRVGRQLLLRVGGRIEVELRHGGQSARLTLDASAPALLVEPGVWSRQTYRGADAALVVFSDTVYDRGDYFDDPGGAQ
jgi:hypothetical protein